MILPVVGFPGYLVSDEGEVFTERRGRARRPLVGHVFEGYRSVTLARDEGRNATRAVHRIVLEAFVGPRPPDLEARHHNGNSLDNRLGNLSWSTHTENLADIVTHGTRPRGESHPGARVDEQTVRKIRARALELPILKVAAEFGMTRGNVYHIVDRKTWRHVQP